MFIIFNIPNFLLVKLCKTNRIILGIEVSGRISEFGSFKIPGHFVRGLKLIDL